MPQLPPKPWKTAAFKAIAQMEHALRHRNLPSAADLRRIRNFLFIQYESPLGSVVHATPLFEALRCAVPDAHITVAASVVAASVLRHNPYIDRCVVTPNPTQNLGRAVSAVRELFRSMPSGAVCIITTIGNRRPRLALLSLLAGKALRAGHTAAPELYDFPLTFRAESGQIEGNLDILRRLGYDIPFCEPRMFFTRQDVADAARLLDANNTAASPRIAFVTQNSGGQRNQWITDRFQQVIRHLAQSQNGTPIFLATSADAPAIEALRQSLPNPGISLAGKTTVPQLAAVLAQCDLIVSLDTGTFHLARAVELPGVVLAPAWQSPLEWLPVDHPRYRVLRGPSIAATPADYKMEELTVEQVTAAATDLMEKFPASVNARAARIDRGTASGG